MTEMAVGKRGHCHDVQQTKQIIPFIFGDTTFGQNVSELVLGVNTSDLNLRIKIGFGFANAEPSLEVSQRSNAGRRSMSSIQSHMLESTS